MKMTVTAGSTHSVLYVAVCVILCSLHSCHCARILLSISTIAHTPSHLIGLSAISKTLIERGHEVVVLKHDVGELKGLSTNAYNGQVTYKIPYTSAELTANMDFISQKVMRMDQMSFSESLQMVPMMRSLLSDGCGYLFKDHEALGLLKQYDFDMLLTLTSAGCDVLLAEYLKVPFTLVTLIRRMPSVSEEKFGIPIPSSYVPFSVFSSFTDSMSFKERVINFVLRFVISPSLYWYMSRPIVALKNELKLRPDLTLGQMIGRAELWLCQSSLAVEFAQPVGPIWVPIGGITVIPASPLPEDLEVFVQGSGPHGYVIFSLGSATVIEGPKADVIARVFSELPQRFVWRHKGTLPSNLGNNTFISEWIPQNDLLGHPKARLMIGHGGMNGIYEAISHGVPLLVMPMGADRHSNAARVAARGLGLVYDFSAFSEDSFRQVLLQVLNDDKYIENMKEASAILNDRLAPPNEVAAFWIEHVIKFGANHLRLRATEMNFVQLHSLDVLGFLVAVLLLLIWTVRWMCVKCCSSCGKVVRKSKDD